MLKTSQRTIKEIILHCSATPEGRSHDAEDINRWHRAKGWSGIGYHYVIKINGIVENGRDVDQMGAHAKGHNAHSIGICYIGGVDQDNKPKDTRTPEQDISLVFLLRMLVDRYPEAKIIGHNDISDKACPSFDVQDEFNWLHGKDAK